MTSCSGSRVHPITASSPYTRARTSRPRPALQSRRCRGRNVTFSPEPGDETLRDRAPDRRRHGRDRVCAAYVGICIHVRVGDLVAVQDSTSVTWAATGNSTRPHALLSAVWRQQRDRRRPGAQAQRPPRREPARGRWRRLCRLQIPAAPVRPDTGVATPSKGADGTWLVESCTVPDRPRRAVRACVTPRNREDRAADRGDGRRAQRHLLLGPAYLEPHPTIRAPRRDVVFGSPEVPQRDGQDQRGSTSGLASRERADLGRAPVIWQAASGSSHADEGWCPYTGGGIYDPSDPTGGHHDHVHPSPE